MNSLNHLHAYNCDKAFNRFITLLTSLLIKRMNSIKTGCNTRFLHPPLQIKLTQTQYLLKIIKNYQSTKPEYEEREERERDRRWIRHHQTTTGERENTIVVLWVLMWTRSRREKTHSPSPKERGETETSSDLERKRPAVARSVSVSLSTQSLTRSCAIEY